MLLSCFIVFFSILPSAFCILSFNIAANFSRISQAVDHPYLVVYSATSAMRNTSKADNNNEEQVCGICHEPTEDPVVSKFSSSSFFLPSFGCMLQI